MYAHGPMLSLFPLLFADTSPPPDLSCFVYDMLMPGWPCYLTCQDALFLIFFFLYPTLAPPASQPPPIVPDPDMLMPALLCWPSYRYLQPLPVSPAVATPDQLCLLCSTHHLLQGHPRSPKTALMQSEPH